jgi:hypothetical protein
MGRSRRVVAVLAGACALALSAAAAFASPPNPGGPTLSTSNLLGQKRYVAAGDRAHVIGAEDGRFPPMGWHIRGEMGGVWAHPVKLLDGYWFALNDSWVPPASSYTTGAGYVQLRFPDTAGYQVTRTEFSPDGVAAVLVGLTIRNTDLQRARSTARTAAPARRAVRGWSSRSRASPGMRRSPPKQGWSRTLVR